VVGGVVALNAGMARWLEALASRAEIVRLRQPVKLDYVPMPKPLPSRPTKLLSLGNRLTRERRADLMYACAKLGMAYEELGKQVGRNIDPARAIADATIVVGYGRSIIEAMAAGRAAYVYDHRGGDGWVTPSTWERIEATGFLGATGMGPTDRDALVKDLAAYDPQMGADNWKLARRHHAISLHAKAIVDLLRRLAPSYPPPSQAEELSRLARISWDHEREAIRVRPLENRVENLESRLAEERKRSRELRTKLESRLAEERMRSRELRTKLREIRSSKVYRSLASVRRLGRRTLIRSR
jgi:hypothetical protein